MAVESRTTSATPPIGVLGALRRHWIVATLPVIVFVAAAVALGLERPPRYTATASLSVGRISIDNPAGVSGVIEATRSLAAVYSRAIGATAVQQDTARKLGSESIPASDQVSATPIPESPLIKVSAESSSAQRAIALAIAASDALAGYVRRQERSDEDAEILSQYERAVRRHRERVEERNRLARRYRDDRTSENDAARDRANVAVRIAVLRGEALRARYLSSVQRSAATPVIGVFARATSATSDRTRMLQIMVFLGLVAGLASGTALALLRAYRKTRPRAVG